MVAGAVWLTFVAMITPTELRTLAEARFEDAKALLNSSRYDGAIYLSGYALELALKARICTTLGWDGYPTTRNEFEGYTSLKTHNLDVLLRFSGIEASIKVSYLAGWNRVRAWNPEQRYNVATAAPREALNFLNEVAIIFRAI